MAQISISLPEELEVRIRDAANTLGYPTLSDYIRESLSKQLTQEGNPSFWDRSLLSLTIENNLLLRALDKSRTEPKSRDLEIIENGYQYEYNSLYLNINRQPLPPEISSFVRQVFDCYDDLQRSAKKLTNKKLQEDVKFRGYDGNNEAEYLGYARFLIKYGQWSYIEGNISHLNSHMPMLAVYSRMLKAWEKRRMGKDYDQLLTADDLQFIVGSQIHSENILK